MKKYVILIGLMFGFAAVQAQLTFGVKVGSNTTKLIAQDLEIKDQNGLKKLGLAFRDGSYGIHFGVFLQGKLAIFRIRPELIFSSDKVNYDITEYSAGTGASSIKSETYQKLDMPLMIGAKLGFLRLMAGPVAHLRINTKSELTDLPGYLEKNDRMSYGFQLGAAIDIRRLSIEGRFEGNFADSNNKFHFYDQDYEFSTAPSRWLLSLGYRF